MSKKKAIVCTILFTVVVLALWTAIFLVPTSPSGVELWPVVTCTMSGILIGRWTLYFYKWLMKESK